MAEQMPDRKKIFISYSKHDADITLKLCNELERHGCDCWIYTRDIAPGEDFTETIGDAIKGSSVLLLGNIRLSPSPLCGEAQQRFSGRLR